MRDNKKGVKMPEEAIGKNEGKPEDVEFEIRIYNFIKTLRCFQGLCNLYKIYNEFSDLLKPESYKAFFNKKAVINQ